MQNILLRPLGQSDLYLSPIGLGTWQFSGDKGLASRFWSSQDQSVVETILRKAIEGGINWLDTADAYGHGQSERNIAQALQSIEGDSPEQSKLYIADKWWPLARTASSIAKSIRIQKARLNGRSIDLYQIHHPSSFSSIKAQMKALANEKRLGQIAHIGVSNFSARQMRKAQYYLKEEGFSLLSNQLRYNLFDRSIEQNGILETAQELGISIIAYSPLHQGLLSGKFHDKPERLAQIFWMRKAQYHLNKKTLRQTQALIELLKILAEKYDCSPSQIALNWLIHVQGEAIFAIPGASKLSQLEDNLGAMRFKLSKDDLNCLSDCKIS